MANKRLFTNRKRIVVYLGRADYEHVYKKAGKGKIGAWIRKLISAAMGWDK